MSAFALQHLGKGRLDEDRLDEALHLFEQALAVRLRWRAADGEHVAAVQRGSDIEVPLSIQRRMRDLGRDPDDFRRLEQ